MPYLPSNRALLDRYRQGQPAALEEVYVHYSPGLARSLRAGFVFEMHGQRGQFGGYGLPLELADALQETFTRAFAEQTRLAYDGLNPFGAWLMGIAHNLVVDHIRRRQTGDAALQTLSASGEWQVNCTPAPDVAAEENEAGRLLATFRSTLEARDHALFAARYETRLTQEETARSLGLTRIQVRRAELKLRQKLLEHLKRNGFLQEVRMTGWTLGGFRSGLTGKGSGL